MEVAVVIKVGIEGIEGFLSEAELHEFDTKKALEELETLHENGWVKLPAEYDAALSTNKYIIAQHSSRSPAKNDACFIFLRALRYINEAVHTATTTTYKFTESINSIAQLLLNDFISLSAYFHKLYKQHKRFSTRSTQFRTYSFFVCF